MKIGILTHPLINNYGGILQAYALTQTLKSMGHEVVILKRQPNQTIIKLFFRKIIQIFHINPYYRRQKIFCSSNKNQAIFVRKNIPYTKPLYSSQSLCKECEKQKLNAFIVGSDQVWRSDFCLNYGYDFFGSGICDGIKKISYAASFGLNSWNYTIEQTKTIKKLLREFRAISVREYSGLDLCEKELGLSAKLVLDPTLLLNKSDYNSIMSPQILKHYVFVYWLGDKTELAHILKNIDDSFTIVEVNLRGADQKPSINDWLSYINFADFVITDSFHGCVFSLIFQKKFTLYCNKSGGYSRLESLFKYLGIEEKLENPCLDIDYVKLQSRIKILQEQSLSFLQTNLN